jgi:hypothetical protein
MTRRMKYAAVSKLLDRPTRSLRTEKEILGSDRASRWLEAATARRGGWKTSTRK